MIAQLLQMFGAVFCYVFVRAFQQRNVTGAHYWWIVPTAYMMAALDVFIVVFVVRSGWHLPVVLANGTGGGCGAIAGIFLHKRWVK
jgi:hypothetical protein